MNDARQLSRELQLEAIVDEFTTRLREGHKPQITDYLARHPEVADELEDVLSAVLMVEDAQPDADGVPERLPDFKATRLGDYHIVREIGRGGMGVVYEAVEEALGRTVALKLLPAASTTRPDQLLRFRREARAAARLEHPHIVPVYGIGQHDGQHYIAMQFIVGQGLDRVIAELRRQSRDQAAGGASDGAAPADSGNAVADAPPADSRSGHFDSTLALAAESTASGGSSSAFYRHVARIGAEAAEALQSAHAQRIVHRDIKPSNLLLDTEGHTWVTDFGLAKLDTDEELTQTGDIVGTLRYMAPERLRGWEDPTSDIYSLGLTLYELVTLQPAFSASDRAVLLDKVAHDPLVPPRKLNDRIPRDLETIILKAAARERSQRYQTAEALAADLRRFQEGKPILARRTPWQEQVWLWCRRNPQVAGLAAGLAASLVIGLAAVSWNLYRLEQVNASLTKRNTELNEANLAVKASADEAESRFRDALMAIDEFLTKVADTHLSQTPGAQELRAELLTSALRFYRDYIRTHEDDEEVQYETANAWLRVAQITDMVGSPQDAIAAADSGLPIAQRLHESGSSDRSGVLLGHLHMVRGNVLAKVGRSTEAAADNDASIAVLRDVADRTSDPAARRRLAQVLGSSAIQLRHQQKIEEAIARLMESAEVAEMLISDSETDRDAQETLATTWGNLGNVLIDANRIEDGFAAMERCREIAGKLHEEDPGHLGFRSLLQSTLANEAVVLARQKQFDQALPLALRNVELTEQLHFGNPGVKEYKADLAQQYQLLAAIQAETGDAASTATRDKSRVLLEELVAEHPDVLRYQLNLAAMYNDSATDLARQDGQLEAARDRYLQSRALANAVLEKDSRNAMAMYLQTIVTGGLAGGLDRLGQHEAALLEADRLVDVPGRPDLDVHFRLTRAKILAHLGRADEAIDLLGQPAEFPLTPKMSYNAAATWACLVRCRNENPVTEDGHVTGEECAARALECLEQAVSGGALDSPTAQQRLVDDPDLDAIRELPEFQALVASLPDTSTRP